MPNESENYSRGASGFGAPNYASPAWRAGDLERQRLQQEKNQETSSRHQNSVSQYSGSTNDIFGFPILIFMALSTWGVVEINSYFNIADSMVVGVISVVVFYIIGIFIRNILLVAFGIGIVVALIAGLAFAGYSYFSSEKGVAKPKITKQEITKQEIMKILNDSKPKIYLPKGVAGSSVIPTEAEMIKRQCGSCSTNLSPGSAVANNKTIISNCATVVKKCNEIGITW